MAPRYAERPGGYTRIIKLGPRQSDSTEMVYLELVRARRTALMTRPQAADFDPTGDASASPVVAGGGVARSPRRDCVTPVPLRVMGVTQSASVAGAAATVLRPYR